MIKTPLSLAIAFTLACIGRAHAIDITIDLISAYSVVQFNNANPYDADTVGIRPQNGLPYEFSTFAQANDSTASATWGFSNKPNKAIFYSSASLVNNNPLLVNDRSRALTSVYFTLTETVDYTFSGSFNGVLDPADTGTLHIQTIEGDFATDHSPGPLYDLYAGTAWSTSSGLLSLPAIGDIGFSSGGPLTPGSYAFSFIYDLVGGSGTGQFELTLSAAHPEHPKHPHVSDAGSTLTLLGMALGGLGFIRHRI